MADRNFLRDTSPSGNLPWRSEGVNVLGCYSIIDDRGRSVAVTIDPVDADLIVEEHNAVTQLEADNQALRDAMNKDQDQTADLLIELRAGMQEAQDLAKQLLLECNKLAKSAPKLRTDTLRRLTKLAERRLS
jgi:hypothetical protein